MVIKYIDAYVLRANAFINFTKILISFLANKILHTLLPSPTIVNIIFDEYIQLYYYNCLRLTLIFRGVFPQLDNIQMAFQNLSRIDKTIQMFCLEWNLNMVMDQLVTKINYSVLVIFNELFLWFNHLPHFYLHTSCIS